MKLYRIYTEDKDREGIRKVTSKLFTGFTMYPAYGVYNQTTEPALIIEIIGRDEDKDAVRSLAKIIKDRNNQEIVLVTEQDIILEVIK